MTSRNPPPFEDKRLSQRVKAPRRPGHGGRPTNRPPRGRSGKSSVSFWQAFVFALVGLAAVLAAGLAFLIIAPPANLIRDEIVAQVKRTTGRDLTIAGSASFSVLPMPGISLSGVALAAPPDMAGAPFVTMDRLDIRLKLLPLLSGKVAVDTLALINPVVDLRIDKSGRRSWHFSKVAREPSVRLAQAHTGSANDAPSLVSDTARRYLTGASETGDSSSPTSTRTAALSDLQLGEVRIVNATIRFADERRDTSGQVDDVNITMGLKSLADPLEASGNLTWRGEKVLVTATLTSPETILRDSSSRLVATLEAGSMLAGYDGLLAFDDALTLDGALIVETNSLRQLAGWFGTALPQAPGYGPLSLQGRLTVAGDTISLLSSKSSLDGAAATGEVTITTGPPRPYIKANLQLTELDLNKYIGPPAPTPAPALEAASSATEQAPRGSGLAPQSIDDLLGEPASRVKDVSARKGWSDEPVDLRLLAAADAEITLVVDRLLLKGITTGRSRLSVALRDATMQADLEEVQLYEGTARGIVTLNAASEQPGYGVNIVVDGISAKPLLKDAADVDWLSGRGTLSLALTSQGVSEREIVGALAGTADFRFVDGAIAGFNIAQAARGLAQGRIDELSLVPTEKTDFSDLSATFKIADGIAESDNLRMASPLLRVTGAGKVMLPPRQLDFTVRPKLVADLTGQGGQTGLEGIEVPVRIHGSFDKLRYTPDVGSVLKDPEKTGEAVKKLSEKFKGKSAQEIIDSFVSEDAQGKKKIDTKKLLNNLFGN